MATMSFHLPASLRSAVLALLAFYSACVSHAAEEFTFGSQVITVPDGYTVELAATAPLTDRPIIGDFDTKGRLFLAESSGSNADIQTQLKDRPHSILCLEDEDGDGVFDKRTVFADRMMFPAGVLCYRGSVYVSAPPSIWKLTDTDHDGIADQREEWLDAKTLTGCANDLHGPYLGRDGWIYWCKGAFAEQTYPRANGDGEPFVTKAAHIFRQRPEGSEIEAVMTGGMDNPVEVAFSPLGERFFTSTFVQHPGGGQRDGILHAVYGGVYGKDHDVIAEHPRTSENLMPIMTHVGNAAACALEWIDSPTLGMQGDLLASQFNLRKITRHQLHAQGATYRTEDSDFLVSDSIDFHPTDIIEDADGSLLVIDTGGWYKLCCPTSQLHKPDVPGAIYRVRKTSANPVPDPRGLKIDWDDSLALVAVLGDPRQAVRDRAMDQLAISATSETTSVIPALQEVLNQEGSNTPKSQAAQAAIWTLCRIDSPQAREAIRDLLLSSAEPIRVAALHAVAVWRDREAIDGVRQSLGRPSAAVRRAAAEAAGRMGDKSVVPALFSALEQAGDDTVLRHSLVFALIEIADPETTRTGLSSPHAAVRIAAMTALDQMGIRSPAGIQASDVLPAFFGEDEAVQDQALRIMAKHEAWAAELVAAIPDHASSPFLRDRVPELAHLKLLQQSISRWLTQVDNAELKALALHTISKAEVSPIPDEWMAALLEKSKSSVAEERQAAITALSRSALPATSSPLIEHVRKMLTDYATTSDAASSIIRRLQAGSAGIGQGSAISNAVAELAVDGSVSDDFAARRSGMRILSAASLTSEQLLMVIAALPKFPGIELSNILPVIAGNAEQALPILAQHPALPTIPVAVLQEFLKHVPAQAREAFESQQANLFQPAPGQAKQLEETLAALPPGDVIRGQKVFNSTRSMCKLCHAIGYSGGKLGPDLTRIGTIRSRRDMLEAIMFPSASLVRSYESVLVTVAPSTPDAATEFLGILRGNNDQEITLAIAPDSESRIPHSEIQSIIPAKTSLMPPGLHLLLQPQELSDLLTFLENTRWK
ncbi:MAG: putative membrane-bound dehydrogenase-like protein [Verrucomicrobiales bacterium]|jgi:putative membrane-bound dehydrogenase-like protein